MIDRLEVGPVRIEKRRISAPYRVVQNGTSDATEFQYAFEEDVFDPAESADRNLAAMMAAQVALNYGLFCKRIVFHDPFDQADCRFLGNMAENTAREIYVKKFLEPNPFLVGDAAHLSAIKQPAYLRAKLEFPHEATAEELSLRPWPGDNTRHAIPSSGGKDSLLSFGLLREIGVDAHPVFVNESGRHWFTAINAHRHFAEHVPNTTRVWTNSDRIFAWMLRHLPFIRRDFANVRSDEYPIRLWTVAIFVFATLPIVRKRGIGRLVMGDEHDTTVRKSFQGISHYDGLFDQSRFFDNAMTRYFNQKRWNVSQFSLLRPASELLIQKILALRYTDLQRLQVSCHAAHVHDRRALPCGQCEKCRRIVGMLIGLGGDPKNCGYDAQSIDRCLKALATKPPHQELPAIQHLAWMLAEKGVLAEPVMGSVRGAEQPEVIRLRFDPQRSPIDGIPVDLRERLYRILLEHAAGAARRVGKVWVDFDPLHDPSLHRPYVFEGPARSGRSRKTTDDSTATTDRTHVLGELTWPDAARRFKEVDIALLPVGAIEQHGPHLPLDTDAYDAEYLARRVAEQCKNPKPLVFPLIPYGVSYHHDDFSGTISIGNDTLARLTYEVGMSAARNGITKLVIINGHGGNAPALHFAAQMINRDAHIFTCVDSGDTSDADIEAMAETQNDVHAGEIETSTSLATRPELVRMDQAKRSVPRFTSRYLDFSSRRSVDWYARTSRISKQGVMGDPTKATREKGEKMWDVMIRNLVEFVEELKPMSLDEIHQRGKL